MPERIGAFQYRYSSREQKLRDTLEYLVARYGLLGARLRIRTEAHAAAWQLDLPSEQYQYWYDLMTMVEEMKQAIKRAQRVGL